MDGSFVVGKVAICVVHCHRRLAKHIEGMGQARRCILARTVEGIVDTCSKDEVAPQNACGAAHSAQHDAVADPGE